MAKMNKRCGNCGWYLDWYHGGLEGAARCTSKRVKRAFGQEVDVKPFFCCKYWKARRGNEYQILPV